MRFLAILTTTETTETSWASAYLNEKENKKNNKYYGMRILAVLTTTETTETSWASAY